MQELKIKHLSAKISDLNISRIDFTNRVKSEHLFASINEALQYLACAVSHEKINPDNLFYVAIEKTPVLYANIIDEAVCSIAYESFLLINKNDEDAIGYYRVRIDEFIDELYHDIDNLIDENSPKKNILNALITMLRKITIILNPTPHSEELVYGDLALYYYNLMYTIYKYLVSRGLEKDYFIKLMGIYTHYIAASRRQHSPMGCAE